MGSRDNSGALPVQIPLLELLDWAAARFDHQDWARPAELDAAREAAIDPDRDLWNWKTHQPATLTEAELATVAGASRGCRNAEQAMRDLVDARLSEDASVRIAVQLELFAGLDPHLG